MGLLSYICLTATSTWIYIIVPAAPAAATAKYSRPLRLGGAVVMIPNPRARLLSPSGAGFGFGIKCLMENRAQKKDYLHYNHTDRCRNARWTSRFCFRTFSISIALIDLKFSVRYFESDSVSARGSLLFVVIQSEFEKVVNQDVVCFWQGKLPIHV